MITRILAAGWLILYFTAAAFADTTWVAPGTVSGNWTAEESPYIIQGNIHVPAGENLAIGPGVRVYFDGLYRLEVDSMANFSALGTEADSIVFTTDTVAHPLRWSGIRIRYPQDTIRLNYCVLEFERRDSSFVQDTIVLQPAIYVRGGPGLVMTHSSLRHNWGAGALFAAGLFVRAGDCVFSSNYSGCYGGAAYLNCESEFRNCLFEENECPRGGGALHYCFGCDESLLEGCTFRRNRTNSGFDGGGAIWHHHGVLNVEDCSFIGDSLIGGFGHGGAILSEYLDGDIMTLNVNNSRFIACRGGSYGNAIALRNGTVRNCTIVDCDGANNGCAIWSTRQGADPDVYIVNTIIANSPHGSALPVVGADDHIRNCLFFGNAVPGIHSNADSTLGRINTVNANGDSCDVYQNLFLDPLFADAGHGDYHLTRNSPCIDAGDPESPLDPDNTVSDLGAFYFDQMPSAPSRPLSPNPSSLSLAASPNPFNAVTRVSFSLPAAADLRVTVYDVLGRLAATLAEGRAASGEHELRFDGSALSSGLYFLKVQAGSLKQTQKIVLMK